jgi:hypothetical protein
MPQYILVCNHPRLEDTDPEPDETYYEIIYRREEHIAPETVSDDESALKWAENHTKEEVCCRNERANPQPLKLVRVLKQW